MGLRGNPKGPDDHYVWGIVVLETDAGYRGIGETFRGGDAPWWESLVERTGEDGPVVADGHLDLPEGPGPGIEFTDEAREHVASEWEFVP